MGAKGIPWVVKTEVKDTICFISKIGGHSFSQKKKCFITLAWKVQMWWGSHGHHFPKEFLAVSVHSFQWK